MVGLLGVLISYPDGRGGRGGGGPAGLDKTAEGRGGSSGGGGGNPEEGCCGEGVSPVTGGLGLRGGSGGGCWLGDMTDVGRQYRTRLPGQTANLKHGKIVKERRDSIQFDPQRDKDSTRHNSKQR